jgi:CheY-like chemotaxis protein
LAFSLCSRRPQLRTPLTPALLLSQELLQDSNSMALPPSMHQKLDAISNNIQLQVRLIDDLLDVTKIEQHKIQLQLQHQDMHVLVQQAISLARPELDRKQQRLTLELQASSSMVLMDTARMHQVLWNLLRNANKFTRENGHISFRSRVDLTSQLLELQVSDDGIGIRADVLPKLFTAFQQGDSDIARRYGGLGLGLSIVRSIVEMHGGSVNATSEGPDRGSVFTMLLPLSLESVQPPLSLESASSAATTISPRAGVLPGVKRQMRILLVEDNMATLMVMERLLSTRLKHVVTCASSVKEALEALEGANMAGAAGVDLLISDLSLPDGSGLDLMRTIRQRFKQLPALALTAHGSAEDRTASREAGFDLHITKPISLAALEAALEHICGLAPAPS